MTKKKRKKVLVVLGGDSRERSVSLESGKACAKALRQMGYPVKLFDPLKNKLNLITKKDSDIIFNALHGKKGEDGKIQKFFELIKIPYTHSGILSSRLAMNKITSKKIFTKNSILSPDYFVIKKNKKKIKIENLFKKNKLKFPVVIKPSNEGSSIGVKICKDIKDLKKNCKVMKKKYDDLIIEKYIGGKEIQVAVMNGKSLGAIELEPQRRFYDYQAKYLKSAKTNHIMPANIKKKYYDQVLKIAEKAHKALKCRGVTRSDFKFFNNKFYLLEINTQPGMTSLSLVPEIAKYKGISFNALVESIILDSGLKK